MQKVAELSEALAEKEESCTELEAALAGKEANDGHILEMRKCDLGHLLILRVSFSAVSTPIFGTKYSFESSRRDLHNTLSSTALNFFSNEIAIQTHIYYLFANFGFDTAENGPLKVCQKLAES